MGRSKKKKSSEFFFTLSFMIIMTGVIGLFIGYLWIYNAVTGTIEENEALRRMETQLEHRNQELQSAVSQLSRGDRIKQIARTDLHMVTPPPESLVVFLDLDQLETQ